MTAPARQIPLPAEADAATPKAPEEPERVYPSGWWLPFALGLAALFWLGLLIWGIKALL